MAQYGTGGNGNGILLYGVIMRDRIKSASLETLMAYRTVGQDLAKGKDGHDGDLQGALADLEKAIEAKQPKK
jgi:hypothetical protein